jgi:hypothetical protein
MDLRARRHRGARIFDRRPHHGGRHNIQSEDYVTRPAKYDSCAAWEILSASLAETLGDHE